VNLLRETSWDALAAFAEFAEQRNFTLAARRLHLSQPALHTKVANLAQALGVPLYERRGRQIEITDAGRRVQRFAHELAASAMDFAAELDESRERAPVVLCAGEGAYLYLLGAGIRAHRGSANRALRLETAGAEGAVEAVLSARAHLGVAALERPPRQLAVEPFTRVAQVLAVPARHALAGTRAAHLRDLEGAALVVPPQGRPHRAMIEQALQSADVKWQVAVEANGWELMLHFVRLGLGLAIVNECCRMPAGVVARALPELPALQYHLFHARKGLSEAAVALKRTLLRTADDWKSRS
jgi:DNA-binding transcriptional LysR family regulator